MASFWGELMPLVLSVSFVAGVLGNITAAMLWGLPTFVHLHSRLSRHHTHQLSEQERRHEEWVSRLDIIHDLIRSIVERYERDGYQVPGTGSEIQSGIPLDSEGEESQG